MLESLQLHCPGVVIAATDTEVGKTVATCALAWQLRRQGRSRRVGVCKPFASGCRRDREGLVSEDAEALAHFADCRQPLDVVNPVRYAPPVAPGMAAEMTGRAVDMQAVARSLTLLSEHSDVLLVEGVGGIMTPLDRQHTFLDFAAAVGYPVLVVARAMLGTLNHTAMTVRLLREAGCTVLGLIVNGYEADVAKQNDASMASNRDWLQSMNDLRVLATLPRCETGAVQPQRGRMDEAILEAMGQTHWPRVLGLE